MRVSRIMCTAIASCAIANSAEAGFTVTAAKIVVGGFNRFDIVAVNTGGDTGTQIKGLEYFYSGSPAFFQVDDTTDAAGGDPDGIPDTVNLLSTSRTRIRVSATAANNVFVGVSPTNSFAQPNPYEGGITAFQGAIANTGVTQASGSGFQIARIFIPQSAGFNWVFSGNLGGDIGSKVPFSVNLTDGPGPEAPVISPVPPVNVLFGQVVTNGAPFSANVTVTSSSATDILTLSLGSLPAAVQNVQITPASGPSPQVFTVSGIVDYAANGTDVVIPIVAGYMTGGPTSVGSITLHVTPEPTSVAIFTALLALRRRRKVDGPVIAGMDGDARG